MQRKFSVDIVFVFTLLIIITISSIFSLIYYKNKNNAIKSAHEKFEKSAQALMQNTDEHMEVVQLAAEIATQIFKKDDLKLAFDSEQSAYLLKVIRTHKHIALFYYGDTKGNFLQIANLNNKIYIKLISRKNDKFQTTFKYYDDNDKVKSTKYDHKSKYDPRLRPWYIGAKEVKKTFWTDPYIFFETGNPGITVSVPVFSKNKTLLGVVGADITLNGLSGFLKEVELTKHGIAYITDAKGYLLAYSREKNIVIRKNGKVRSLKPKELKNPAINAVIDANVNKQKSLSFNGKDYLTAFLPFPNSFGKKWNFTIVAPEDDFTGAMKETLRQMFYISIAGLAIGVFITMLLARKISKPIELLSKDVLEVRNFNLDSDSGVHSHIHEIQVMDNAIRAMKNSLKAFRLYLPSVLVKQLVESGESIEIGGKERDLTLFFSDIADFTTISEKCPPEDLMLQLSEYFDAMTNIIEKEKGTVDKFIGDAVMAFWGAPLPNDNHPLGACHSALQCQRKIKELNAKWGQKGKEQYHTRIGIHSGPVTVGNIGAKQRMNYTVLGDGVNLASRLEGVNKIYKTDIIISHSTYLQVKEFFKCRVLDQIAVKGKDESIKIYELLTESDSLDVKRFTDFANKFQKIYELYLKREWQKAKTLFQEFAKEFDDDHVCQIYIKRCDKYIKEEPNVSWNGATKLNSK